MTFQVIFLFLSFSLHFKNPFLVYRWHRSGFLFVSHKLLLQCTLWCTLFSLSDRLVGFSMTLCKERWLLYLGEPSTHLGLSSSVHVGLHAKCFFFFFCAAFDSSSLQFYPHYIPPRASSFALSCLLPTSHASSAKFTTIASIFNSSAMNPPLKVALKVSVDVEMMSYEGGF